MLFDIVFETTGRIEWVKTIADSIAQLGNRVVKGDKITLHVPSDTNRLDAMHFVSLACLNEYFYKKHCSISFPLGVKNMVNFLRTFLIGLKWHMYWGTQQDYTEAKDPNILNLWRLTDNNKESYSQQVYDYLKRGKLKKKDLSAVQESLQEACYNIFDHAEAAGIAFSFIRYDEEQQKLSVAVCDLGKGIATAVRTVRPEISDDSSAIELAMQTGFTTRSTKRNRGFGLDNIRMACTEEDALRIISNRGYLVATREQITKRENPFNFPGTLIFYDLSLSHFDDEEIVETFEL